EAPPLVIEPLFTDEPLDLAAPLPPSEPPVATDMALVSSELTDTSTSATVATPRRSTANPVDTVEPLPRVSDAQLATAFEYPSTDAPLESNDESLPANRSVGTVAPVLSSEPLTNTEPVVTQIPAAVAPRTYDAPLSTSTTPPLPSAPRIQEAMLLTNQASVDFQKGVALATRGSLYAARGKFLRTLDQLSQAADAQAGSRTRESALQAALRALEEMEDFVSRRGGSSGASDLTLIVRSHQTKVIAFDEAKQLTTTEALMRYLQFAKQQLAEAFQSMAHAAGPMHALGRVYDSLADHSSVIAAQDKARVFYESALAVDPTHSAAANDLAVLLARHGRWNEACGLLTRSVTLRPTAAGYQNLAVVQERLGQLQLAAQSRQLAASGGTSATALADPALVPWQNVRWLEAKSFAQTSELASDPRAGVSKEPGKPQPAPVARTAANPDLRAAGRWQQ
ncbi:MAG: hypothetical protein JNM18_25270, partial [Planctomycetaceae bacterium]|nr:hypothetical protein [Planctomycetaceae bacterium]